MKSQRVCLVILALIVVFSGGLASLDCAGSLVPSPSKGGEEMEKIEVKLKLLQATANRWEFELTVQNAGDHSVFVMASPTRVDGTKGWYVSLDEKNPSVLEVSSRFYSPPPYFLYANNSGIALRQLPPEAIHSEKVSIEIPVQETMPPYGAKPDRATINHRNIKFVRAVVGLIPDEEGVRSVLEHKLAAPFVNGFEGVIKGSFKGKRLIDLQTIAYSGMLNL